MNQHVKPSEHPHVVVRRKIRAERERVFDAWTKPELMQQWLIPGPGRATTTNELRIGGKYMHKMMFAEEVSTCKSTETTENGEKVYPHSGEYLEIQRPERLVFTWNSPAVTNTKVTVELRDLGSETEVIITHELIDSEEQRKSHQEGWEGVLQHLASFIA